MRTTLNTPHNTTMPRRTNINHNLNPSTARSIRQLNIPNFPLSKPFKSLL